MGYDIVSKTTDKYWSCHHDWGCFVDLAEAFGWAPEHHGDYYISNDNQEVSNDDALAMAKALTLAIDFIKEKPVNMKYDGKTLKTFEAANVSHLRALADLTGAGGFTIR